MPPSQAAFRAVLVKYDQRADVETDASRLRVLAAERAADLGRDPRRGAEIRRLAADPERHGADANGRTFPALPPRSVRPTYWDSGPGAILREAEIVVSGRFFPGDNGGPFYESARISWHEQAIERARFRAPYFSIRLDELDDLFPERRFP